MVSLPTDVYYEIAKFSEYDTVLNLSLTSKNNYKRLEIVKLAKKYKTFDDVSFYGSLSVIKWMHKNMKFIHIFSGTNAVDYAAGNGNLEMVKWLHTYTDIGCTTYAMDWASGKGDIEMGKWLHENRDSGCTSKAMDWASGGGYFELVKWLQDNRKDECVGCRSRRAVNNGHPELVKYMMDQGYYVNRANNKSWLIFEANLWKYTRDITSWIPYQNTHNMMDDVIYSNMHSMRRKTRDECKIYIQLYPQLLAFF